jgi:hypothetical protein
MYPIDEWHDWYRDLLAGMQDLTPADVLARWVAMAAPSYQDAGGRPSDKVLAASPRHKYLEIDGRWWVRDDDAAAIPTAEAGISWDAVGPFLRLPTGEMVRDRATARRHLGGLASDPTVSALLALFFTGRQDGKRKTMSREILARALVILGLRDGGLRHLEAIRLWLRWESDLGGALSRPDELTTLELGARADLLSRQNLRDCLADVSLSSRRIWRAIGLTVEFASPRMPS